MGGRVKLTVGSLFSGIGGFDLGFERAGWAVKWQVENDPFCNRQDGTQGFSMEINADRVVFLSSRQDAAAAPDAPPQDVDKLPW